MNHPVPFGGLMLDGAGDLWQRIGDGDGPDGYRQLAEADGSVVYDEGEIGLSYLTGPFVVIWVPAEGP